MDIEDRVISWLANQDVEAYLAGGCVRDRMLGHAIYDLDVAVAGDGLAWARRLADYFAGDYYPLDIDRGTGRAILRREDGERFFVDIARLRGRDLAADLAGRDFTINALAVDVHSPALVIDCHGGLADLEAGLIRAVSNDAIREDPVRALRAFRLAAQLGFALDGETEELVRRDGAALADVSAERICEELGKLLVCGSSAPFLLRLESLGLLLVILPELAPLRDLAQSPPHQYDVLTHSIECVRALEILLAEIGCVSVGCVESGMPEVDGKLLPGDLSRFADRLGQHLQGVMSDARPRLITLKMAALLHDVGKPDVHTVDVEGRIRFLGHEDAGSRRARQALERLRFSGAEARLAETIVRHHMRPLSLARQSSVSSRAVYRFFRDTGDAGIDILLLALADHLAILGSEAEESGWQRLVELVTRMLGDYWEAVVVRVNQLALVNGRDLIRDFGLEPGPQIGRLLGAVREAQAIGEVRTRAEAIALVGRLLEG